MKIMSYPSSFIDAHVLLVRAWSSPTTKDFNMVHVISLLIVPDFGKEHGD